LPYWVKSKEGINNEGRKEVNTMMPGIDPQKLAEVQQFSQYIKAEIVINYNDSTVTIKMSSDNLQAAQMVPGLLSQFAEGLAAQLQSFFAIKGEIIEVGKK